MSSLKLRGKDYKSLAVSKSYRLLVVSKKLLAVISWRVKF